MTTRAPDGMSSVDAFNALYTNASVFGMGRLNPSAGETPGSPWNAIQIFKKYCPSDYCQYVRGKYMKVGFRKFPEMDTGSYDNHYGEGAAKKAIESYQKTMDQSAPKETYDLGCKPCTYFTSFWKQKTPVHQREDLEEMFSECERLEVAEKRAEAIPSTIIFDKCKTRYTLVSPYMRHIDHNYKPCQEVLDHFKMLLQSRSFDGTTVGGLSICRYNSYLPFLQRCQGQSGKVSLDTARKILESQTPKV